MGGAATSLPADRFHKVRLEEDGGAGRRSTWTRLSVFSAFCSNGKQLEVNADGL